MPKKSVVKNPKVEKQHKQPLRCIRRKVTKKAKLISFLRKNGGADIASLSKKLGWQAHSTRAAMTGLRKSGYVIELTKAGDGKPSRYHISSVPAEQGV